MRLHVHLLEVGRQELVASQLSVHQWLEMHILQTISKS